MPEGRSPRSATIWRMPCSRYCKRIARRLSFDEPMHDRCGAASKPSAAISSTLSSVPCCVEPPAPKVTETNLGESFFSSAREARSLSTPSCVFGGKNSNESSIGFMVFLRSGGGRASTSTEIAIPEHQCRQQPRHDAVQNRAEERGPEARHFEALQQRRAQPEAQRIHDENE